MGSLILSLSSLFFVFAHYSTSLYYITIPNVPWGPPNVKVVQIALCLNFLMSSAELLFKAHTLLLVLLAHPEYLVAYLLHELLENFWAAHAFCPFGAMPARLVLHAPSALQKGPCYTHTYYEGPLMLVCTMYIVLWPDWSWLMECKTGHFGLLFPKLFFVLPHYMNI